MGSRSKRGMASSSSCDAILCSYCKARYASPDSLEGLPTPREDSDDHYIEGGLFEQDNNDSEPGLSLFFLILAFKWNLTGNACTHQMATMHTMLFLGMLR